MYEAALDRITRWVPELKGTLERVAAKVHKPPVRSYSKRTNDRLREFVRNNLVTLRARSGDGVLQKLRTRNPDQSFNKPEKRWYSWMRDKRRTAKEKADMAELNALVNYSAGHRK